MTPNHESAQLYSRNLQGLMLDPAPPVSPAILGFVRAGMGFVPNDVREMNAVPGLLNAMMGLFMAMGGQRVSLWVSLKLGFNLWRHSGKGRMPPPYKQLAAYACSLAAGCRYCQAHTAHGMERLGLKAEQMHDILKYDDSEHFSEPQRAVIALGLAAGSHPNAAGPEHFKRLAAHFNRQQIIELLAHIALFGFLNRWNDTLATQLEDQPAAVAERHLARTGWEGSRHGK